MAKHEFRFIIDGLDLSTEQQARISTAIQNAGTAALLDAAALGGGTGGKRHAISSEAVAKAWGIGTLNGKYLLVGAQHGLANAAVSALKIGPEINPATLDLKASANQ